MAHFVRGILWPLFLHTRNTQNCILSVHFFSPLDLLQHSLQTKAARTGPWDTGAFPGFVRPSPVWTLRVQAGQASRSSISEIQTSRLFQPLARNLGSGVLTTPDTPIRAYRDHASPCVAGGARFAGSCCWAKCVVAIISWIVTWRSLKTWSVISQIVKGWYSHNAITTTHEILYPFYTCQNPSMIFNVLGRVKGS